MKKTMIMMKLKSSDGKVFIVDMKLMRRMSGTIKRQVDQLLKTESPRPKEDKLLLVVLPKVSGSILEKVIAWANFHKDDVPDEKSEEEEQQQQQGDGVCCWDSNFFMQMDQSSMFGVITAANYLDMKDLLDAGCQTVANMIRGKSTEQIRLTFCQNKMSQSEKDRLRLHNGW